MDFISVQEAATQWGISERRIQKLCEENRIPGVVRFSRMWLIPKDAKKPIDGRVRQKAGDKNE
ncbi:helix-turn-helix domain-containing protein [Lutispora saccharofermentans]|uniref:Helix-turn-helix domain-containing protein n=1 Tax=Lutispora saccharofermentans TaxID=3024236 RepID=A0ABT1NHC2_9FIRM|nr:helix-turn-helix domain-containing protein [Lutispora saccharofermentans]MCQ1529716.1 helix-turn-helix domain-containing protein [Lutispora saccharofermentans]